MEYKKEGKVKKWIKEHGYLIGTVCVIGAYVGLCSYAGYKTKKKMEAWNEMIENPETWKEQAREYEFLAEQAKLTASYYEKGMVPTQEEFEAIVKGDN